MLQIFRTPINRDALKVYWAIAVSIGAVVSFILVVFQPFGTAGFEHPYKFWILMGYGVVSCAVLVLYYWLSFTWINRQRQQRWTLIHELIDLSVAVTLCLLACYLYALLVFGFSWHWRSFAYFMRYSFSVALLPVSIYGMYMFFKFKDVQRGELSIEPKEVPAPKKLILKGNNRKEELRATEDELLFVKSADNYVILYLWKEDKVRKYMIRSTMQAIAAQLNPAIFTTCHRSYLVNISKVIEIRGNKNNSKLYFENCPIHIPVSRGHVDRMRQTIRNTVA